MMIFRCLADTEGRIIRVVVVKATETRTSVNTFKVLMLSCVSMQRLPQAPTLHPFRYRLLHCVAERRHEICHRDEIGCIVLRRWKAAAAPDHGNVSECFGETDALSANPVLHHKVSVIGNKDNKCPLLEPHLVEHSEETGDLIINHEDCAKVVRE